MIETVTSLHAAMPFTRATWFTLITLLFFVWLFAKASRDPSNPIKWEHLIVDADNDRASPYKVGYLIGLIVGTWIVLRWADTGALTYDIFGMYLTYLLGGAGVNSFSKKGGDTGSHQPPPKRQVQRDPPRPYDGTSDDEDQIPRP